MNQVRKRRPFGVTLFALLVLSFGVLKPITPDSNHSEVGFANNPLAISPHLSPAQRPALVGVGFPLAWDLARLAFSFTNFLRCS